MNNKAFTIVELIMSFIFVTIVSISMYGLVVNYRSRTTTEAIRNELNNFKAILTIDIEKDIEKNFLNKIDYCKDGGGNVEPRCIVLTFNNGDIKTLSVKEESVTETIDEVEFTYSVAYVMYGDVRYSIPDGKFVNLNGDFLLNFTTSADDIGANMALYRINISFKHEELDEEFNIKLTALGNVNTDYGIPGSYTEYNTIGTRVRAKVGADTYWFRVIRESSDDNSKVTLLYDDTPMVQTSYYSNGLQGNRFTGSLIEATLKFYTKSWSNPNIIRLITAEELAYIANKCPAYKKTLVSPMSLLATAQPWLYSYSYWTMTPLVVNPAKPNDAISAWYVDASGIVYGHLVRDPYYLRPVIVISKDYII